MQVLSRCVQVDEFFKTQPLEALPPETAHIVGVGRYKRSNPDAELPGMHVAVLHAKLLGQLTPHMPCRAE